MRDVLKQLDIFGKPFYLNIKKRETFKSIIGGILTTIMFIGSLGIIYYFGQDIYFKVNPLVTSSVSQLNYYPYTTLNSSNFLFAINLHNGSTLQNVYTNRSFIEFRVNYHGYFMNNITGLKESFAQYYPMSECSTSHVSEQDLINNNLSRFQCALLDNFEIGGMNHLELYKYLRYELKRCDSSTEQLYNIKCAPALEIDNLLFNSQIGVITQRRIVNNYNFEVPIIDSYSYDYYALSGFYAEGNYIHNSIYYNPTNLLSDTGFIFSDITRNDSFIEFKQNEKEERKPTKDFYIYKSNIYLSNYETERIRIYIIYKQILSIYLS